MIQRSETMDAWRSHVDKTLSTFKPYTGFTSNTKLLSALESYLRIGKEIPFAWRFEPKEEVGQSVENEQETHYADVKMDVNIREGQSILLMGAVLLNCKDGKITQTPVTRYVPVPSSDDFDFSSIDSYANIVSSLDDSITDMSDSINKELLEKYLNPHVNKDE